MQISTTTSFQVHATPKSWSKYTTTMSHLFTITIFLFSTYWICIAKVERCVVINAVKWWKTNGTCDVTTSRITVRRSEKSRKNKIPLIQNTNKKLQSKFNCQTRQKRNSLHVTTSTSQENNEILKFQSLGCRVL